MEKINNIIILIFSILFINVKLTNRISLEFVDVDDCIREIDISGEKIFEYRPENISMCDHGIQTIYDKNNKFLLQNYEYEYGKVIKFIFQDSNHYEGYHKINVHFNEYIIKPSQGLFWECENCIDGHYHIYKDRMNFYADNTGDQKI